MLLAVVRRGRHGERDCERGQTDGGEVQVLLDRGELLIERVVEHHDQLKSEQCLQARQHRPAFTQEELRGFLEREVRFRVEIRARAVHGCALRARLERAPAERFRSNGAAPDAV
jgi:hypothetical protein